MPTKSRQLLEKELKREVHKRKTVDSPLLLVILMLMATGLVALFTASYPSALYNLGDPTYYLVRQGVFAIIGVIMMAFISRVPYPIYALCYKPIMIAAVVLLILVPFIGQESKGATRWIGIGDLFTFQPSEIMKFAVIVFFAYYISKKPQSVRTFKGLCVPYGAVLLMVAALLVLQPHMSATMIIFLIGFAMLFAGGMRLWYFAVVVPVVSVGVVLYLNYFEYAMDRVRVWIDPWIDFTGDGWQGAMSAISIGSGGLWGLGLGQGKQKHLFLPEPQNDFVFSALAEELGFIGACLVLIMFAYLIYRGYYIALRARDKFGCMLAVGIVSKFAIQTLINLFVVSGILPVTGASLPLFSYGGTALLLQLYELGVLLNISRYMRQDDN